MSNTAYHPVVRRVRLFEMSCPFLLVNRECVHAQVHGKGQFFHIIFFLTFAIHSSFDGDGFDNHLLVGAFFFYWLLTFG